jgi:predicted ABC-type ATPase
MDAHAYIIARPNGAGKTTFAREFLPKYVDCREFLNADLIAAGISPFDPDSAAISAGRVLLSRMRELIRQGKDFGFETTLAGRSYMSAFRQMKERGYRLHLFYLWVPSAEMAIARVARRVEQGGHNVNERVVRRRFHLGLQNLRRHYLAMMDSWFLFDSSDVQPEMIARCDAAGTVVLDSLKYERIPTASGT